MIEKSLLNALVLIIILGSNATLDSRIEMSADCCPLITWLLIAATLSVAVAIPSRIPRVLWYKYGQPPFMETKEAQKPVERDEIISENIDLIPELALPKQPVDREWIPEVPLRRCGVEPEFSRDPYIVNVIPMPSKKWPYFCQATLISDKFVLTSAHCVAGSTEVIIISGLTDPVFFEGDKKYLRRDGISPEGGDRSYVGDLVCPSKDYTAVYNLDGLEYSRSDFALVRLKRRVTLSKYYQTACLPNAPIESSNKPYVKSYEGFGDLLSFKTYEIQRSECARNGTNDEGIEFCYSTSLDDRSIRKLIVTKHRFHHIGQPVILIKL